MASCFEFLEEEFLDIYSDCERMEKNLINGGGIESIMLCGRINEKITKKIYELESILDCPESQFKRVQKLADTNILPNNIKNNFREVRRLRNDVYHDNVGGELASAREAHKLCFKIAIWFYENYSNTKSFIVPKYKISRISKEVNFLNNLKKAVNSSDFNDLEKIAKKNNSIIKLLSELKIAKSEIAKSEDKTVYKLNNPKIKIRKPEGPYSKALGVFYDDKYFMWVADFDGKQLGLFDTPKEAYEFREIYLHSVPIPPKDKNGNYSEYEGISFSKIHRLWTASVNGKILGYYGSEKKALNAKKDFINSNKIVNKKSITKKVANNKSTTKKVANNKSTTKGVANKKSTTKKVANNKSTTKGVANKKVANNKSTTKGVANKKVANKNSSKSNNKNKLSYGSQFKKSKNNSKNKVKVKKGSKIKSKSSNVKVKNGSRVKSKDVSFKKVATKHEGVYYEEGLFMWSAEVNGKSLGLFASETEAFNKRKEYLKLHKNS